MTDAAGEVTGVDMPPGLLGLATALVAVPSVSHHETAMADATEAALRLCPWLEVVRIGDNVVARTDLGRHTRVALAGHLDTVPPVEGNEEPRLEGDTLYGVGAADMKGGLAVLLHLAGTLTEPRSDLTFCFYACEEVEQRYNGLRRLWDERPDLLAADAAILAEPTGGAVEAGCQGTMRVQVELAGRRAHTARPASGRNAIHRLAPVLDAVASYESRRPVIDGCEYVEQVQVVDIAGGVAGNVVPDRASVLINHRFAPDRNVDEAGAWLKGALGETLEEGDRWEVVESAPGAPPALDHPVLSRLVEATDQRPVAKLGWTDVSAFWAHGVPAANFGPGDPLLSHTPGEHVGSGELEHVAGVLEALLRIG